MDSLPEFYPTLAQVSIPRNPSPFAVFAAVRATCLENRRRQTALLQLQSTSSWKDGDDADANDANSEEEQDKKHVLPKIIGIGLQGVFEIIRECKNTHPGDNHGQIRVYKINLAAVLFTVTVLAFTRPPSLSGQDSSGLKTCEEIELECILNIAPL